MTTREKKIAAILSIMDEAKRQLGQLGYKPEEKPLEGKERAN